MCFSTTASFGAGVVLTVIGIASIQKTHNQSQLMFASIPLIFGVQQIAEGLLWISLPNPDLLKLQKFATYLFIFFAQIIWSMWVPIAIILLEKKNKSTVIQKLLVGAGLLVGCYFTYCLITFGVEAKIRGHHIAYLFNYPPSLGNYVIFLYALATITPAFFSHIKRMWIFGTAILISYLITALFYDQHVISVWCFFASLISISIYLIVVEISRLEKQRPSLLLTNRYLNYSK